ncbi:MAG TPA: penicillin-binding transpeptidase domain-containing protein [Chloroflexota bacterium]|nr:penicillin-binding transpeptidase domain-containing protein [Chloroflexota bacterium]
MTALAASVPGSSPSDAGGHVVEIAGVGPALRAAAASLTGSRRAVNQDRWLVLPVAGTRPALAVVADGVGGEAGGEHASQAAIEALEGAWRAWRPEGEPEHDEALETLTEAARAADAAVQRLAAQDERYRGAATTLTAVAMLETAVVVVHAGDSRAYLVRGGVARQLTSDHALAERRNVITRYLGQEGGCSFDAQTVAREPDHRLVLCTDGVSNLVTPFELAKGRDAASTVRGVMEAIGRREARDDATMVVLAPTGEQLDPFRLRSVLRPSRTAMRRRPLLVLGAGAAAIGVVGTVGAGALLAPRVTALVTAPFRTPPLPAAQAYFAAWQTAQKEGQYTALYEHLSDGAKKRIEREAFTRRHEAIAAEMTLTGLTAAPASDAPAERSQPGEAELPFDVTYATARFGDVRRRGALPLVWERGAWRVNWQSTVILPELEQGRLVRSFSEPLLRGSILDRQRRPLATTGGETGGARTYPQGQLAGPLVGYTGQVTAEDLPALAKRGYLGGDTLGRAGVEASADALLVGQRGGRLTVIHPTGEVAATLATIPSRSGESVLLSLDLDLQRQAEALLGNRVGSIIVIDPAGGGIRAMASFPRYDPNAFTSGQGAGAILSDPGQPVLNRPVQGVYSPGSTFKVLTMAAGLESGLFRPDSEFSCSGRWTGLPGLTMACWNPAGHGRVNLLSGLTQSCNIVFYEIGKRLDEHNADFFPDLVRRSGLGTAPGALPGAEAAGTVPSPAWKRETVKEPWVRGDAVNMAIGQGRLLVSPLQMASVYAAIAAGGRVSAPRLVERAVLPGGNVDRPVPHDRELVLPWSGDTLAQIRTGLKDVVGAPHGTAAFVFQGSPLAGITAGKTGTAESGAGRPSHAWFACFAPFDAPRAVVLVMLEHGGEGSRDAAPVARRMLEAALAG